MKPQISIIVPIYLSEPFLENTIRSLRNQTFKNIEIILVNDESPDNSIDICTRHGQEDNRITIINQKNQGQASAWQNATIIAKAEFIMFLDADDWYNVGTCELAYETIIKENADIVMWPFIKEYGVRSIPEKPVFSNYRVFTDESLQKLRIRAMGLTGEELGSPFRTDAFNSVWGKIYRKQVITENNIRFESTSLVGSTDVLFNNEMYQVVNKVVYLNHYLTHYRQYNPNSLTKNYKFQLSGRFMELFRRLEERIVLKDGSKRMKLAYSNRVAVSVLNIGLSIASPNLKGSFTEKKKHLSKVLCSEPFNGALSQLNIKHMPIHWEIYFLACKRNNAMLVYFISKLMVRLR